jgi:hypothetical protein
LISILVQFLEDSPILKEITPQAARERLRQACALLPVSKLLLGWNIPRSLFDAVAEEAARLSVGLYRWQPLLTGDGTLFTPPEWQVVGVNGERLPGFRGLPEFTFMCPNKPAVQEAVSKRLREISTYPYQGVFLDRIRFPSPTGQPFLHLACFCEDCCRAAWGVDDLDLAEFRKVLCAFFQTAGAATYLSASLLGNEPPELPSEIAEGLQRFLRFRKQSILNFARLAAETASAGGMEIGLDCFSPSLTGMVGQDLPGLSKVSDWIKVMTYAHAWGPAGLAFEFMGLAVFLCQLTGMSEAEALIFLQKQSNLGLPHSIQQLRAHGLTSSALALEVRRGREMGLRPLYAGLELVEIERICELNTEQIRQDWSAVLEVAIEGVVLSWDLWHMPPDRLRLVSDILVK